MVALGARGVPMSRRPDRTSADRADAAAAVRPGRQSGSTWCETCGERIPPDEPPALGAAEPRCAACRLAMGIDLQSYLSHHSKLRPTP